jgi:hypothetical protein
LNFKEHIAKGQVRKTTFDKKLFESLIKTAESDLTYLNYVKINKLSARKTLTNYYDVTRSYLEALGLKHNYKIYSHEAYTYFLKELKQDILALKFDRQRKIRNKINYYGDDITIEETIENIKTIKEIIKAIKELLKK